MLFYCIFRKLLGFWIEINHQKWLLGVARWLPAWKLLAIGNIENACNQHAKICVPAIVLSDESNEHIRFRIKWTPGGHRAFILAPTSTFQCGSNQRATPSNNFLWFISTQNPKRFLKMKYKSIIWHYTVVNQPVPLTFYLGNFNFITSWSQWVEQVNFINQIKVWIFSFNLISITWLYSIV